MVTSFKTHLQGFSVKYSLDHDVTTWGKGIANGYSFCAPTGKKKYMELRGLNQKHSPRVFLISSTHGAESVPIVAFLDTLKIFKRKKIIIKNKTFLNTLGKICEELIKKNNLDKNIKVNNSDWFISFSFLEKGKISAKLRTLFMLEMIKNKVLFQGLFIPCFIHGFKKLKIFKKAFEKSLAMSKLSIQFGFKKYSKEKIVRPVFIKYN